MLIIPCVRLQQHVDAHLALFLYVELFSVEKILYISPISFPYTTEEKMNLRDLNNVLDTYYR